MDAADRVATATFIGGAKTAAGAAYNIYERGNALLSGDLAGAFPDVAGVVHMPFDLYEGIGQIAEGNIRTGVASAAPPLAALLGLVKGGGKERTPPP